MYSIVTQNGVLKSKIIPTKNNFKASELPVNIIVKVLTFYMA